MPADLTQAARSPHSRLLQKLCLLLFAFLILCPTCPAQADQATDDFNLAVGLYRKQRWDLAAESFRRFMQDHPDHARTNLSRLYLGLSLNSLEQYKPARDYFEEFIRTEPESSHVADARYRIAECSYHLKEFPLAIEQFDAYLKAHPQHELANWARLFSGDAHYNLQQWDSAVTVLKQLLDSSPQPQLVNDARYSLARSLEGQNNTDEALAVYQELSQQTSLPVASRADLRIGAILFRKQSYKEAALVYDRIVANTSDPALRTSASLNAGLALYRSGDYQQAIVRLQKVPDDSPLKARTTMLTGLSYRELKEWDKAREALDRSSVLAADTALAPEILFERAQLERLANDRATAAQMFEDFADRWPADQRVAECLFNAAELHLELAEVQQARSLHNRLAALEPQDAPSIRTQVLNGRILLKENQPDQAISTFLAAISLQDDSESAERSAIIGRYYLVRTYHQQSQHQNAIDALQPLLPALDSGQFAELQGVLAVAAISSLQLQKYTDARQYADQYLTAQTDGSQQAEVLAARCVALAKLQQFDAAVTDANSLAEQFSQNPLTWNAIIQAAETAWNAEDYPHSASLFQAAANQQQDNAVRSAGLSGQAWSLYRQDLFPEAGTLFRTITEQLPQSPSAPESQYMYAMTLFRTDQPDQAIAEFRKAFQAALAVDADSQELSPLTRSVLKYGFDSGEMAAQLLGEAGQTDEADQMWEALVTAYPNAESLDRILYEWAYLNLASQRYNRSDQVYRQLLSQFPNSRFAGQARLSLAESDMQADRTDKAITEFKAIVDAPDYADSEKEKALYQLIDIYAKERDWAQVRQLAKLFADRFSTSDRAPRIQLLYAESLLDQKEPELAEEQLQMLRKAVMEDLLPADEWTQRIWVLLGEVALATGRYQDIDTIVDELIQRVPDSRLLFQLYDVQGRRWKGQAEPNFETARQYFQKVVQDEHGRGTATAASCQFMIAETYLLQKSLQEARREYYRVYLSYDYDDWQARGLFQAAGCENRLGRKEEAIRGYRDLLNEFPNSELVERAKEQLAKLTSTDEAADSN
jgi:TolA-binding protein